VRRVTRWSWLVKCVEWKELSFLKKNRSEKHYVMPRRNGGKARGIPRWFTKKIFVVQKKLEMFSNEMCTKHLCFAACNRDVSYTFHRFHCGHGRAGRLPASHCGPCRSGRYFRGANILVWEQTVHGMKLNWFYFLKKIIIRMRIWEPQLEILTS
jgi:hypothetical protein